MYYYYLLTISKIGATRCQILRLMHQIRFPLWLRPRSRWGSFQRYPRPLAVFKGPTSKRREEKGRGREREKEGRGGEGRGGLAPNYSVTPLTSKTHTYANIDALFSNV